MIAIETVGRKLAHGLVAGFLMIPIENTPGATAGNVLQARVRHSEPAAVPKSSMKVSIATQFGRDPTLFHTRFKRLQCGRREIFSNESVKDSFGGQHAALDRRMNSFQACGVQEAGAVADDQHSI